MPPTYRLGGRAHRGFHPNREWRRAASGRGDPYAARTSRPRWSFRFAFRFHPGRIKQMTTETRRSFTKKMLGSLLAYGLIETMHVGDLFADSVKPIIQKWLRELQSLCADVKGR